MEAKNNAISTHRDVSIDLGASKVRFNQSEHRISTISTNESGECSTLAKRKDKSNSILGDKFSPAIGLIRAA